MKLPSFLKAFGLLLLQLLAASVAQGQVEVFSVRASQNPESGLVEVRYRLVLSGVPSASVSLRVTRDGGVTFESIPTSALRSGGAFGGVVQAGDDKLVIWDPSSMSWATGEYPVTQVEVSASAPAPYTSVLRSPVFTVKIYTASEIVAGVRASMDSEAGVLLTWPGAPETWSFSVYRGEIYSFEASRKLNTSPVLGTSFLDTTAEPGRAYFYFLLARDSRGFDTKSIGVSGARLRPMRLVNVSARGSVAGGQGNALNTFGGFIVRGGEARVLAQGAGPRLRPRPPAGRIDFNVPDYLRTPRIDLWQGNDGRRLLLSTNSGWEVQSASSVAPAPSLGVLEAVRTAVSAYDFEPGSADAATLVQVSPGPYTLELSSASASTGTGVFGFWLDRTVENAGSFSNVSARGVVKPGATGRLTAGVVIEGSPTDRARIVAVGLGPYLQASLPGALGSPSLTVRSLSGTPVASNSGWASASNSGQVQAALTAVESGITLDPSKRDCAVLVDLAPGAYTFEVSTTGADQGIALVGVWFVEQMTPPAGMVRIPSGTFLQGTPPDSIIAGEPPSWKGDLYVAPDVPQRQVTLTRDFYLRTTEMTVGECIDLVNWAATRGYALGNMILPVLVRLPSSRWISDDEPFNYATWNDVVQLMNALSEREGLEPAYRLNGEVYRIGSVEAPTWDPSANGYRLPTEAEWEYACRAGTVTDFYSGPLQTNDPERLDPNLDAIGWYWANAGGWWVLRALRVREKTPNAWGLYDMSGGAGEWCWDSFGPYDPSPQIDPTGSAPSFLHVIRGGGASALAAECTSAARATLRIDSPIDPTGPHSPYVVMWRKVAGVRPARNAAP